MIDLKVLAKFKRQAPQINSQLHFNKIMVRFAEDDHAAVIEAVKPLLQAHLSTEGLFEVPIVPKDPANPTIHESTAMRLNLQSQQIADLTKQLEEARRQNTELAAKVMALQPAAPKTI